MPHYLRFLECIFDANELKYVTCSEEKNGYCKYEIKLRDGTRLRGKAMAVLVTRHLEALKVKLEVLNSMADNNNNNNNVQQRQ